MLNVMNIGCRNVHVQCDQRLWMCIVHAQQKLDGIVLADRFLPSRLCLKHSHHTAYKGLFPSYVVRAFQLLLLFFETF